MKRILVVVDGTTESNIGVEYATAEFAVPGETELVLLYIRPPQPSWKRRSGEPQALSKPEARILERAMQSARVAGVECHARFEVGEAPETVTRVAGEEDCELIVWPEPGLNRVARAVLMLTGVSANAQVNKIISTSPVPVTVVTDANLDAARASHEVH